MELIIFDEIEDFPYLRTIFVILGPIEWVKIVTIFKNVETFHTKVF